METFKGGGGNWAQPRGCHLLSELRKWHWDSILHRFFLKIPFHCLHSFTFITSLIHWPLFLASFCVYWCWTCLICSGLTDEIYSGVGPSMYIYCVICYCVIAVTCIGVGYVCTLLHWCWWFRMPLDYEMCLLPKVVFLTLEERSTGLLIVKCGKDCNTVATITNCICFYICLSQSSPTWQYQFMLVMHA